MKIGDPAPKEPKESILREDIKNISGSFHSLSNNLNEFKNIAKDTKSEAISRALENLATCINQIKVTKDKKDLVKLDALYFITIDEAIGKLSMRLYSLREALDKSPGQDLINIAEEINKERIKIEPKVEDFNRALLQIKA